ncbi:MAG: hypothetical protein ACEPOW_12610 [Bacteroidales bacterium]
MENAENPKKSKYNCFFKMTKLEKIQKFLKELDSNLLSDKEQSTLTVHNYSSGYGEINSICKASLIDVFPILCENRLFSIQNCFFVFFNYK